MVSFVAQLLLPFFFFSSRRRHTRLQGDWSSDVCSSDLSCSIARSSASTPRALPPTCCHAGRNRASATTGAGSTRSEEHTSELQSPCNLVCRLLLEKKKPHAPRATRAPPTAMAIALKAAV